MSKSEKKSQKNSNVASSSKKKTLTYLFIAILGIVGYYVYPLGVTTLQIYTGFNAKRVCTNTFYSKREDTQDMLTVPMLNLNIDVNKTSEKVIVSLFGVSSIAVYKKGFGCTLVFSEEDEKEWKNMLSKVPPVESHSTKLDQDWPKGNKDPIELNTKAIESLSINSDLLTKAIDNAFKENSSFTYIKNTRALLVIVDGTIVAERYVSPFTHRTPLLGWSMNKSILNALIGIRIKEGKLSLKDKVNISYWKNHSNDSDYSQLTIDQLLRMSSGLKFRELYDPLGDAPKMLFSSKDYAGYASSLPFEHKVDSLFAYSSGTTNILSRVLRESFESDVEYWEFPRKKLFDKLGADSFILETDASGTFALSSFGYATPRDWAKFGALFLNNGVWEGEQILPVDWVKYTTTPTPSSLKGNYGAHWWLNVGDKDGNKPFPDLPSSAYFASGFETQYVMIVPSKKLLVVRMGNTRGDTREESLYEINLYVSRILASLN